MYFSRAEFAPNAEVAEEARQAAEQAVLMADHFQVPLDGSEESLEGVEQLLGKVRERLTATGLTYETAEPYAVTLGSYFGEVLCRKYGGEWGIVRLYSEAIVAVRLEPKGIVLAPSARTLDRLMEGPGKSLLEYYERLARSQELEEMPPEFAGPAETGSGKLYPLQHEEGYFEAGVTADGRQVLWDEWMEELFVIFFDAEGTMLGWELRPLPRTPEDDHVLGAVPPSPEAEARKELVEDWKREIGFQPQPIRVRKFSILEEGVGIEDRPWRFEEFLRAPELMEPDEEERRKEFESIREWDESGNFVLYWGNDLWLDREGQVESS